MVSSQPLLESGKVTDDTRPLPPPMRKDDGKARGNIVIIVAGTIFMLLVISLVAAWIYAFNYTANSNGHENIAIVPDSLRFPAGVPKDLQDAGVHFGTVGGLFEVPPVEPEYQSGKTMVYDYFTPWWSAVSTMANNGPDFEEEFFENLLRDRTPVQVPYVIAVSESLTSEVTLACEYKRFEFYNEPLEGDASHGLDAKANAIMNVMHNHAIVYPVDAHAGCPTVRAELTWTYQSDLAKAGFNPKKDKYGQELLDRIDDTELDEFSKEKGRAFDSRKCVTINFNKLLSIPNDKVKYTRLDHTASAYRGITKVFPAGTTLRTMINTAGTLRDVVHYGRMSAHHDALQHFFSSTRAEAYANDPSPNCITWLFKWQRAVKENAAREELLE